MNSDRGALSAEVRTPLAKQEPMRLGEFTPTGVDRSGAR